MTLTEAKNLLRRLLSEELDPCMADHGFSRSDRSLKYRRAIEAATHGLEIQLQSRGQGKYLIIPWVSVQLPEVSQRALQLVAGDRRLLADAPDLVVRQQLQHCGPKREHVRWQFSTPGETRGSLQSLKAFWLKWGLPLLDDLSSPTGLIRVYEDDSSKLLKQQHWYVFLTAAYLAGQRLEDAKRTAEERLGRGVTRARYESVFDALSHAD